MASSSKATIILLVYGILVHYSVFCTPLGLSYPKISEVWVRRDALIKLKPALWMSGAGVTRTGEREILDNDVFDEDGNTLPDMGFDTDQIAIRSPDEAYTLYYPPDKRSERHAEEELDRALREILGQLTARHYLHSLMTVRAGEDSNVEDESGPLYKRHSDGIFTDSYSRYRKQMAVQKYLAAVLGRRYRQRVRNKGRRMATYL